METETDQKTTSEQKDGSGRLARLAAELRGLVEDVRTWIDLKLKLLEVEIEERIRDALNRVAVTVIIATLMFLSFVFVLVTAALALGVWWDSPTLGFLAVTLVLIVVTILTYVLRPGLARRRGRDEAAREVGPAKSMPRLGEARANAPKETGKQSAPASSAGTAPDSTGTGDATRPDGRGGPKT